MLSLAACGGGGGSGGSGGGSGGGGGGNTTVTVSGTVSYEFVPPNFNCNGLNFAGTITRPIRGATIQLLDGSGAEIASATSAELEMFSWYIFFPNMPTLDFFTRTPVLATPIQHGSLLSILMFDQTPL